MIKIASDQDLNEFFRQEHAILFFDAPWSKHAVVSKQMVEFVESYANAGKQHLRFFSGQFEGDSLPLAERLVAAGVPQAGAFTGSGSLSFFRRGEHIYTIASVIGEGTFAVWRQIDDLRENHTEAEQGGTGQPATRPVDEPEGGVKPQPEAEGRSR